MGTIRTKGNLFIDALQVGDVIYEFSHGCGIKSLVTKKPTRSDDGIWRFKAKRFSNGEIINYAQNEKYPHYGLNIYDYKAYSVNTWL